MAPALLLLIGSPWLPFSPRWLMAQGREDEAHEVLIKLHKIKEDPHDTMARKEFYQMKKQVDLDRQIKATTSRFELFKTAPNRRRALVGFLLMWNNQFTGVLVVSAKAGRVRSSLKTDKLATRSPTTVSSFISRWV